MSASVINGANNVAKADTQPRYKFRERIRQSVSRRRQSANSLPGQNLVNRVQYAVTLGNGNVNFTSIPYGGTVSGTNPLFVVGNSSTSDSSIRSNAITVLFNGRTQINTTGFSNALTQANVTPKAALEVVNTNTGVLLPKLTTTQRNAIASPDLLNGLLLYNTDSNAFQFYNGSTWNARLAVWRRAAAGHPPGTAAPTRPPISSGLSIRNAWSSARPILSGMTILANGMPVGIGTPTLSGRGCTPGG